MTLTVEVHEEDGVLWGHVVELPGCFATGTTLDELMEALGEAIALYQADTQVAPVSKPRTQGRPGRYRVHRLTLVDAPAG
jgi:predicted RNase H-like HicB family nuclease